MLYHITEEICCLLPACWLTTCLATELFLHTTIPGNKFSRSVYEPGICFVAQLKGVCSPSTCSQQITTYLQVPSLHSTFSLPLPIPHSSFSTLLTSSVRKINFNTILLWLKHDDRTYIQLGGFSLYLFLSYILLTCRAIHTWIICILKLLLLYSLFSSLVYVCIPIKLCYKFLVLDRLRQRVPNKIQLNGVNFQFTEGTCITILIITCSTFPLFSLHIVFPFSFHSLSFNSPSSNVLSSSPSSTATHNQSSNFLTPSPFPHPLPSPLTFSLPLHFYHSRLPFPPHQHIYSVPFFLHLPNPFSSSAELFS